MRWRSRWSSWTPPLETPPVEAPSLGLRPLCARSGDDGSSSRRSPRTGMKNGARRRRFRGLAVSRRARAARRLGLSLHGDHVHAHTHETAGIAIHARRELATGVLVAHVVADDRLAHFLHGAAALHIAI